METTLQALSRSETTLTQFYSKKRPERKLFSIRLDTQQIIWSNLAGSNSGVTTGVQGFVDIRMIKEIRHDRNSFQFDRFSEDARRYRTTQCFVIHYGTEFCLQTISCAAESDEIAVEWVNAVRHLMEISASASYVQQVNRYLRAEFHGPNYRVGITLADLKAIMTRLNIKIPMCELTEAFLAGESYRGEINFDGFYAIYRKFVLASSPFDNELQRKVAGMDGIEFLDHFFSTANSIWKPTTDNVTQDMKQPLTHYWMASSHNTYVAGNSVGSDSLVENYARCLQMGCRCIELDTWDGPDGIPVIYHGCRVRGRDVCVSSSKISLIHVVECIRDHAFVTSKYPVVLSIEDHCSLQQQRQMAQIFRNILGDKLLTESVEGNETVMPSPEQLKEKIIIKHKRLPDGQESVSTQVTADESDVRKSGVIYMKDGPTHEWLRCEFFLTATGLVYTKMPDETENNQRERSTNHEAESGNEELHFAEEWYHGDIRDGQTEARQRMEACSHLGDGRFLVRPAQCFVGDYTLSFMRSEVDYKCRIHKTPIPTGGYTYQLDMVERREFSSLYDLITYYRACRSLRSRRQSDPNFNITLTHPVPQPQPHKDKAWFHDTVTKEQTEAVLRTVGEQGAFLVRYSETQTGEYVLSFLYSQGVIHCRIPREGRLFVLDSSFQTLVELVDHYTRNPIYKRVLLKYLVNREMISATQTQQLQPSQVGSPKYVALAGCPSRRDSAKAFSAPLRTVRELPPDRAGRDFAFRLVWKDKKQVSVDLACERAEDRRSWMDAIDDFIQASTRLNEQEQTVHCHRDLSKLIVYCFSGSKFNPNGADKNDFREMSSLTENHESLKKLITADRCKILLKYNQRQFSRIYPMGSRIKPSNYDPIPMWNCGCQMVALNYHSPDIAMQLNQSLFKQNGRSGYILQPDLMRTSKYNPFDYSVVHNAGYEPSLLSVTIICGRHLSRSGRGIVSPLVEVEIIGANYDCSKSRTALVYENGLNPTWNTNLQFDIHHQDLAFLRFVVYDVDNFGEAKFLAQATFPVRCICEGYRVVQLQNGFSENLELASLLVKIQFRRLRGNPMLYKQIYLLRHKVRELRNQIEEMALTPSTSTAADDLERQLEEAETQLAKKNGERQQTIDDITLSSGTENKVEKRMSLTNQG